MALDKVKGLCTDAEIDIRIVSGLLCGSATAILMLKWVNQRRVQKKLEEAKNKRELSFQRMEKTAKQFKQQNPGVKAAPVLSLPLVELAAKLRDGSLSPENVLYIYIEKALEVTREINCVINYLPECEEQLQEVKKREKGLLYGVPVSIKEDVACKGYSNTLGLVKFLDHPEREDSVIVKVLKKQGAIPFVRTNTSQAILNVKGATTPVAGMNSDITSLQIYSSSRPLRIGYYDDDGYFMPSPSMRRAVQETRKLLQEAGHTLLPFTPPRIDFLADELFTKGLFADGTSTLVEKFDGEFVDSTWTNQIRCYRLPNLLKRILAFILTPVIIGCGVSVRSRSVKNLWKNNVDRMAYRDEFIAEWRKLKLDVVLCPALVPAFNLGYAGKLFVATTYTHLYNVLNFPAGVVPVSTVTQADEEELKLYKGHYGDPWDKRMKEAVEGAVGLPVAVQCVALPWQEELCLRFMKEVERVSLEKRGRRKI
ncbi:hypothetical protein JD844_018054 [Phrynosoma platyrhinos]|uniref:Amidase domain-containing protein n=1 Tax=Phrynosoma platyrhinos TaxID=52577 RepID=A0ABQ7SMR2_PHRPL|nr:hypothetical protein JD844_018054 [Phrynosoma platyrhinos]